MAKPHSQIPDEYLKELAAICKSTPHGAIVEVGVYKGGSAYALNEVSNGRTLHLFDTFEGIPEKSDIDHFSIGDFADTSVEAVKLALPDAVFHVGTFPETFQYIGPIAFVHIDCDQYKTCSEAIRLFWPHVVKGGAMAFDDYPFPGIKKAIHEHFQVVKLTSLNIPYVRKQ